MPRLNYVKKARQDNPVCKAGEDYYWWKPAFRPKQFSKTRPRRSQLTSSAFLGQLYDMQDDVSSPADIDQLEAWANDAADTIENMGAESQESLDAMPEHLQDSSSSGEMLQMRIDGCEQAVSELQSISFEFDKDEGMDEDEWLEAKREEVDEAISNVGG